MRVMLAASSALVATGSLFAQVTVEVLPESALKPELHCFGGGVVECKVAVEAPLGSKVSFEMALFQITSGLAAPLGEKSASDPIEFEKQTRRVVSVPLSLPEVKNRTELMARFFTQLSGEEKKAVAGTAKVFVYPKDQMKELALSFARVEKDTGISLTIFGESKRIRGFLKENKITFNEAGSELPSTLSKTALYMGEVDARSPAVRRNFGAARVILFAPDPMLPPGVYTTIRDNGLFSKVTLPLLDTLATNPQSQRTFFDILRHSLDASAITPSESP